MNTTSTIVDDEPMTLTVEMLQKVKEQWDQQPTTMVEVYPLWWKNQKDLNDWAEARIKNGLGQWAIDMKQPTLLGIDRSLRIERDPFESDRSNNILTSMMYAHKLVAVPTHFITASMIDCGPSLPVARIKYQNRKCLKRMCKHMAPKDGNWCRKHKIS